MSKTERIFEHGVSVKMALLEADYVVALDPSRGPGVGKQLRRDAGDYFWRESIYNVLRGGFLALIGFVAWNGGVRLTDKLGMLIPGITVAIVTEARTALTTGRVLAASFRYGRESQKPRK